MRKKILMEKRQPLTFIWRKLIFKYCMIIESGMCFSMRELTKKEVKQIRKLLKKGVDVPEICTKFNIPPAKWREVVIKNDLF